MLICSCIFYLLVNPFLFLAAYLRRFIYPTWYIFDITWNLASKMITLLNQKERSRNEFVLIINRKVQSAKGKKWSETYHYFTIDVASDLKCFLRCALLCKLLVQVIKESWCRLRKNTRFRFLRVVSGLIIYTVDE